MLPTEWVMPILHRKELWLRLNDSSRSWGRREGSALTDRSNACTHTFPSSASGTMGRVQTKESLYALG